MFVQAIKRGYGCVSSLNKSPVLSYMCVYVCARVCVCRCVCNGSALGSAIKKHPEMCLCVCVCTQVRSRVGMGVCMCVCVCHHHSPVENFLRVYVLICMLTPLNDCDYIRQYFTVN